MSTESIADQIKFAYWVPNVSGGLVISKIAQRTSWDAPYNRRLAQIAEEAGFDYALTQIRFTAGYGAEYQHESVAFSHALLAATSRLKVIAALLPGPWNPTLAAKQIATISQITEGRIAINVVSGWFSGEFRAIGEPWLDHDERYVVTDEFLHIWRGLMAGETVSYAGKHLRVEEGRVIFPPVQTPYPPLYFGGSSAPGIAVAAEHCDVYLTWGEPPAQAGEKIARVREAAAARGRTLRYGVRLHVITRDTSEQAWAVAQAMLDAIPEELVRRQQQALRASESEGQRRMLALHGGDRRNLEIHPGLWAGSGLIRGGAGTALVGSHEEVADLIRQYEAVGFTDFVLSGHPCLEEAWWFGEGVRPRVDRPEASPRTADARRRERAAAAVD